MLAETLLDFTRASGGFSVERDPMVYPASDRSVRLAFFAYARIGNNVSETQMWLPEHKYPQLTNWGTFLGNHAKSAKRDHYKRYIGAVA